MTILTAILLLTALCSALEAAESTNYLRPTQLNGYIPKKSNRVNLLTQAIGARLLKSKGGSDMMSLHNTDTSSLLERPIEDIQARLQSKLRQPTITLQNEEQFQPIARNTFNRNNQLFDDEETTSFDSRNNQNQRFIPAPPPPPQVITMATPVLDDLIEPIMPSSFSHSANNQRNTHKNFDQQLADFEEGQIMTTPAPQFVNTQERDQHTNSFVPRPETHRATFRQQQQQFVAAPLATTEATPIRMEQSVSDFRRSEQDSLRQQLEAQHRLTQQLMKQIEQIQENQQRMFKLQQEQRTTTAITTPPRFNSQQQDRLEQFDQPQQQARFNQETDVITMATPGQGSAPEVITLPTTTRPRMQQLIGGANAIRDMFNDQEESMDEQQTQRQPSQAQTFQQFGRQGQQFMTTTQRTPLLRNGVDQADLFKQNQFMKPSTVNHGGQSSVGCMSMPCQNGAQCVDMPNREFKCQCRQGFTGSVCQTVDTCAQMPCGSDGTCLPLESGHSLGHVCVCQGGKTVGMSCQSAEGNPCVNAAPVVANAKKAPTMFPLRMNPNIFVQCEGLKPNVRFCQFPLKFSFAKQMCDWN